jgi:hypothetical protein
MRRVIENARPARIVLAKVYVVLSEELSDDLEQPAFNDLDVLFRVGLLEEVTVLGTRCQLAQAIDRTPVD